MSRFINEFKSYKESINLKAKSIAEYCDGIERFENWYLESNNKERITLQSYSHMTSKMMQDYIFHLINDCKLSKSSVVKHKASLVQFFKYMNKQYGIDTNAVDNTDIPKESESKEKKYMSVSEAQMMFENASDIRSKTLIGLLFLEGLRLDEATNMKISNVDIVNRKMTFKRKFGEYQTLPIRKDLVDVLNEWIKVCRSKGQVYLFESSKVNNQAMTSRGVRKLFDKEVNRLGLDNSYGCHDLRRAFAVDMVFEKGLAISKVSKLLNHKSIQTTEIYLKGARDEQVYNEFESL